MLSSLSVCKFLQIRNQIDTCSCLFDAFVVHLSKKYDSSVKRACQLLPQLKEILQRTHTDSHIEATLGIGYTATRTWLAEASISFPKSFMEYKTIIGPTEKRMPNTGRFRFHQMKTFPRINCTIMYMHCSLFRRRFIS